MNKIENQLNKAKTSFKSSAKACEIDPKTVREMLEIALKFENIPFAEISSVVLGSQNGILLCGIGLFEPKNLIYIATSEIEACVLQNLNMFKIQCDTIQAKSTPFIPKCIDIAFVGPQLDKLKKTSLFEINIAYELANKVICCFESEHSDILLKAYSNAITLGKLLINIPLSLNYQSSNQQQKAFTVFQIKH